MFRIAIPVLLSIGLILGCTELPGPVEPSVPLRDPTFENAAADSVLALLAGADRSVLDKSFASLGAYAYRRTSVVQQLDAEARVEGSRTLTMRFSTTDGERRAEVLSADSAGSFSSGVFGWFSDRAGPAEDTTALGPLILPEDPPFTRVRGREDYIYRLEADTVRNGRRIQNCLIEARPAIGDKQRIRRARIEIDLEANLVTGIEVVFDQQTLFFRERSYMTLLLGLAPDGAWVPQQILLDTEIGSAFISGRRFTARFIYGPYLPLQP